jgi:uncharacterized membrane protein
VSITAARVESTRRPFGVKVMSDAVILLLVSLATGLLFMGLGIPLLLGRVPPNMWYGCRTNKTLSNEGIWYAVNRVTGQDTILAGVITIISSLVVFAFGSALSSNAATVVMVSVILLSVAGMAFHSFRVSSRM